MFDSTLECETCPMHARRVQATRWIMLMILIGCGAAITAVISTIQRCESTITIIDARQMCESLTTMQAIPLSPPSRRPMPPLSCLRLYRHQLFTAAWSLPANSHLPVFSQRSFGEAHDVRLQIRLNVRERWEDVSSEISSLDEIHGAFVHTPIPQQTHPQSQLPLPHNQWPSILADVAAAESESRAWAATHAMDHSPWLELSLRPSSVLRRCQLLPLLTLPPSLQGTPPRPDLRHLEFLRDKWFLFIGDSTDRYQVQFLCAANTFTRGGSSGSNDSSSPSQVPLIVSHYEEGRHCRCTLPQLNFTLVSIQLHGRPLSNAIHAVRCTCSDARVRTLALACCASDCHCVSRPVCLLTVVGVMEAGWWGTEKERVVGLLASELRHLHSVYPSPPALISLQSLLWDVAGFGEDLWQKHTRAQEAETQRIPPPVHPVLPYLQRLEHYLLRPIASVFGVQSVRNRVALSSPPSAQLFADDPEWMRQAKQPLGRCLWPAPFGYELTTQCDLSTDARNNIAAQIRQREQMGRGDLTSLLRDTASWRVPAADSPIVSSPLVILRSVNLCKLKSERNPSIPSLNAAASLLASAYSLPFSDVGLHPLQLVADGCHLRQWPMMQQLNLIINIFKHQRNDQE